MTKTNTAAAAPTLPAGLNTSQAIRWLAAQGLSRGAIEKALRAQGVTTKAGDPIRYQHIRNVLITPVGGSK